MSNVNGEVLHEYSYTLMNVSSLTYIIQLQARTQGGGGVRGGSDEPPFWLARYEVKLTSNLDLTLRTTLRCET